MNNIVLLGRVTHIAFSSQGKSPPRRVDITVRNVRRARGRRSIENEVLVQAFGDLAAELHDEVHLDNWLLVIGAWDTAADAKEVGYTNIIRAKDIWVFPEAAPLHFDGKGRGDDT